MGEIVEELNPLVGDANGDDGHEFENLRKVEIVLKTIGPARPSRLLLPSSIKVRDLRRLISRNDHLPIENLSLILRGNVLCDVKNGDDAYIQLNDGDCLIVAVKPKPPVRDGYDNDDDDDLKFQLPHSSSWWKKRLYSFLHDNLKLPDILLMFIFSLSVKAWALTIIWFILAPIAHRWDLGPLYLLIRAYAGPTFYFFYPSFFVKYSEQRGLTVILGTGFCLILFNLGKRKAGDVSAYSIFNEDFRELPGTLNADRLDRDIRAGQF